MAPRLKLASPWAEVGWLPVPRRVPCAPADLWLFPSPARMKAVLSEVTRAHSLELQDPPRGGNASGRCMWREG